MKLDTLIPILFASDLALMRRPVTNDWSQGFREGQFRRSRFFLRDHLAKLSRRARLQAGQIIARDLAAT